MFSGKSSFGMKSFILSYISENNPVYSFILSRFKTLKGSFCIFSIDLIISWISFLVDSPTFLVVSIKSFTFPMYSVEPSSKNRVILENDSFNGLKRS